MPHSSEAKETAEPVSGEEDTEDSHENATPDESPQHQLWTEGKGHAHDPLQDHPYLDVGPDPSEDPTQNSHHDPMTVSESPPPADFDVYARAYAEEVERIRALQGKTASVFATRRVERSGSGESPKSRLASLLGKAIHHDAPPKSEEKGE